MADSILQPGACETDSPHKAQKSRLPLSRLGLARELNRRGSEIKAYYIDGFGTTKDPERRPKARVLVFKR